MGVFSSDIRTQAHVQQNLSKTGSKIKKVAMVNKGKAKETHRSVSLKPSDADSGLWNEETTNTPWQWSYLNDMSSSNASPLFSRDGSYFFSFAGSSVKISSVSTGQVVSDLTPSSASSNGTQPVCFTSAVLNPDNAFQLITTTLDGRIIIWDFLNAIILREIDVGKPVHYICAHKNVKDAVFVAVSLNKKKTSQDTDAIVLQVSLNHGSSEKSSAEVRAIGKTRSPSGIAISPSGDWLVATGGHTAYVARVSALDSGFIKYVSADRITCLAMHPSEDYFATGDEKGNIRLWYCLNDGAVKSRGTEKKAQTTSLHWHAHAVASLSFTPNGAYLLSGGEEAVLVIWQLHTGKKEFVPRVGAPIVTISVFQGSLSEEYLLGLQDGTFCFISPSSLRIVRSFSQLKIGLGNLSSDPTATRAPLAFHRPSTSLILPSSHPASLQIYSPYTTELVGELEVSPSNRVSKRDDRPMISASVRQVVLSSAGSWMATVDVREEEPGYHPEIFLKIWSWDSKTSTWQLHSRIDQPHGSKHLTNLKFSPQNNNSPLYLSSCGEDGAVKIWKSRSKGNEVLWLPHATLTFPPSHVKNITWSPDGTIFAVALTNQIMLYDTTFTVVDSLSSFEQKDTVHVNFVGNRHVLVTGPRCITIWDLVSRAVSWNYSLSANIDFVLPHSNNRSFAVFVHTSSLETKAYSFDIDSPRPQTEQSLPFRLWNIISTGPSVTSKSFNLTGLTRDSRIVVIDHDSIKAQPVRNAAISFQTRRPTLFQEMFGGTSLDPTVGTSSLAAVHRPTAANEDLGDLFDQPTHMMAPVSSIFDPLISSLLLSVSKPEDVALDQEDEEDYEMDTSPDVPFPTSHAPLLASDAASFNAVVSFFQQSCREPPKRVENGKAQHGDGNGAVTPAVTPRQTRSMKKSS
ncbi:WD40 repeat-like protein [Coprinopsis marcescibilis]|uniref:WD40 repeat-like protein n=1 Tax=Coprinopsis marcescibilis TaxID=230819 RepID=A0A5C3LQA9_COPMA|nr:WD40 repeat-like protein [Coprinopsis marcescibilis]